MENYGTARQAVEKKIYTKRRMRFVCYTPKVTDTYSEYAIPIIFSLQSWLLESHSVLCCKYFASLVVLQDNFLKTTESDETVHSRRLPNGTNTSKSKLRSRVKVPSKRDGLNYKISTGIDLQKKQ